MKIRIHGDYHLVQVLFTGKDFAIIDFEGEPILFNAYLLEKAVYELGYELDNRPDWIMIPIRGIQAILFDLAE